MAQFHSKGKYNFTVLKSEGHKEPFSPQKLHNSLRRSGLPTETCHAITQKVGENVVPGMSTKDIYKHAFKLVSRESSMAAVHYSLKRAILDLGPTGFEFEVFVARYFEALGFETKVGVTIPGEFVKHEVDVVAKAGDSFTFVECKFHNYIGRKNDIKIVLYVKARWDDLKNGPEGKSLHDFYLATNTSFSSDALAYAKGTGLKLLGLNAPADENFIHKIIHHRLYPITSLKRLKKHIRNELLSRGIILCKELLQKKRLLMELGLIEEDIEQLFSDIRSLIEGEK
ncbi:MAG: restriction endonuclease [Bacteriovoracaceae bacterium]